MSTLLRKQALNNLAFTVPKNRKPKFDLTLNIIDLTNVPLVAGTASVRWHLSSSNAAEHRGRTDKAYIIDHKATWDYVKEIPVRLTIDKNQMLQECDIHFEILQEYSDGGRGGRVHLGNVKLNLAEYTRIPEAMAAGERDPQDDGEDDTITRRYLLQDSKVNSTLKISIKMKQTEGDATFIAPPLKSAMVIGGIAGVLSTEAGEGEDIPSITSKTRELSEAQDIYRRTLAATWACQVGELAPDQLIEDLFAGGDGCGEPGPSNKSYKNRNSRSRGSPREESMGSSSSDTSRHSRTPRPSRRGGGSSVSGSHNSDAHLTNSHHSHHSPHPQSQHPSSSSSASHLTPQMTPHTSRSDHKRSGSGENGNGNANANGNGNGREVGNLSATFNYGSPGVGSTISGRSSIEHQLQAAASLQEHHHHHRRDRGERDWTEVMEMDLRDDLRSWQVRVA
ncbi:hypothetical protein B0A52_06309 [Exophiala mesophila]|uniref:C2 NT-type domain-containing protein n=1 Tax=Exophiala mesophila TaxID=212818 RepID=A0A438N391_EXOME|nr:hypothetical protein B0A52_06309 [Exophiala mesophila]